jgi:hypothetical protein
MFFKRNNHRNEAKKLPEALREYMIRKFNLVLEYLNMLRCFEYDGVVNGKEVRCIHIFSPYRAEEQRLSIKHKEDLDQHPEMLLFEGYMDGQSSVYVADRRPPLRLVKSTLS